jgi:hypothetical protein
MEIEVVSAPLDFDDLAWLVGRYRHDVEKRDFWIGEIRQDFGSRVADVVEAVIGQEDVHRLAIEDERRLWKATLASTYLTVLEAYNHEEDS